MNKSFLPTDEEIKQLLSTPTEENSQFPTLTDEELEEAILDSKLEEGGFNVEETNLKIKEIIAENTEELKTENITPDKHLKRDLKMDNLDKFQMAYGLETEFKIEHFDEIQLEFVRDVFSHVKNEIIKKIEFNKKYGNL